MVFIYRRKGALLILQRPLFSLKFNFPLKPSSAQECRSGLNPIPIRAAGSDLRLIRLPIRQQSGSK